MPCSYKNLFGEPKTGIHSYRIFDLAIMDIIQTIIGGYIISIYFGYDKIKTIIWLFIIGILIHRIFCVNTTINKLIFGVL